MKRIVLLPITSHDFWDLGFDWEQDYSLEISRRQVSIHCRFQFRNSLQNPTMSCDRFASLETGSGFRGSAERLPASLQFASQPPAPILVRDRHGEPKNKQCCIRNG